MPTPCGLLFFLSQMVLHVPPGHPLHRWKAGSQVVIRSAGGSYYIRWPLRAQVVVTYTGGGLCPNGSLQWVANTRVITCMGAGSWIRWRLPVQVAGRVPGDYSMQRW